MTHSSATPAVGLSIIYNRRSVLCGHVVGGILGLSFSLVGMMQNVPRLSSVYEGLLFFCALLCLGLFVYVLLNKSRERGEREGKGPETADKCMVK